VLIHGLVLSVVASAWLLMVLWINPRLMVQDYPPDIQAAVPPKTADEKRMALILGLPLLLVLFGVPSWSTWTLKQQLGASASFGPLAVHAFGVASIFNIVDWLVLDWLLFSTITPRFMVIPGTDGMAGYKNYWFHFRGFLIGTVLSAVAGLLIGAAVSVL
jgi:hypothetical protein